jgi:DNA/RNA endonuclease YhcR with UshA esterase domain
LQNRTGTGINAAMKQISSIIAIACLAFGSVRAQETKTNETIRIQAAQAKEHIGAKAVVSGKVAEVNIAQSIIRINLDKAYPAQPFTAVIFSDKTNLFPQVAKLKGKSVEVSGKISAYHERPQIVLTTTNQLKVVEAEEGKTEPAKP